ncbi:MAG: nitroreductase family protein [Desulfobulbaceae bacterium]|nr:nitroreductase family protein [Desulfobulbaceae bacterium]
MNLAQLVHATRSCRRFREDEPVSSETLHRLIDLARLSGSAKNLQPLKYLVACTPEKNAAIFPHLGWAGYLPEWPGPAAGERPAAYIVCLLDTEIAAEAACDLGIASQNILLGATEIGLAGCRIASISGKLHQAINLPDQLQILLVIALGRPREEVCIEEAGTNDDIRYWRTPDRVHHVPKRRLADIIIEG